jgi:predicted enzyme related to lactoylglutathione lyase
MLERDGFPPGVPCWIDTSQPDPQAAAGFYGHLFGWEFEDRMPAEAPGQYLVARLGGRDVAAVGSAPEGAPPMPAWNTYIWVESADDSATKVTDAGGTVLGAPFDILDAGRMAVCADPTGAVFCLWQAGTHRGAQAVNAPGTWNWSDLNTRDVEGAKAFYGAVFGWEAETVDFGELAGTMWRLPGYGEFLERFDPGLRERHADSGVPAGFSDAIGWMMPMTPDQYPDDVPSHWSVTFSVDDTDAVADMAVALGGLIVAPPFDVGPVRVAVLRDPQGAVFTVSRFAPG